MVVFLPSRLIVVALAFTLVPWAGAVPQGEPEPRQELHFLLATFDPLQDPLPPGLSMAGGSRDGPFVVQFDYPLTGEERPRLEGLGAAVVGYIPDGGFVVAASRATAQAASLLDGVRFVGALPAWLRLRPDAVGADRLAIQTFGDARAVLESLVRVGATPLAAGPSFFIVIPGPGGAAAVAALTQVLWVEPYRAPEPANYRATVTDHVRQPSNSSSYSTTAGALWTFNPDPLNPGFLGYTGEGIKVDVTDQGIDGLHPAFVGRLGASRSWTGENAWVDPLGHGTHVAATALGGGGYFAGDGGGPVGLYAGAAPGATLVAQVYNSSALNYAGMADFAASSGASISLNSWGDTTIATLGAYTSAAAAYDGLTADASAAPGLQPLLFVFSAGNQNNQAGSVTPPGTAKNVLTLGATGNDFEGGTASDDIAPFSSYGPTDDGRIKPDLVAPGERVASGNSSQDASAGTPPLPPGAGRSYAYLSGTSMSAPQGAGAAAVAAQYLRDARGVVATPALLKALLINGAEPLSAFAWPGPEQGWGRLDLGAALLNSSARRVDFVEEGFRPFLSAPDVVQFNVSVDPGSDLKVTLVWTDAAGVPIASSPLVNDLDLEVRDANDSVIFTGNQFNGSYSAPGAGTAFDRANNVEVVRVQTAAAGVWKVFVRAYNLPVGPQSFALAFSGAINQSYADLAASAVSVRNAAQPIESGDPVTIDGEVSNEGAVAASNVIVLAIAAGDPLALPAAQLTLPSLQPGERRAFSLSFVAPDGPNAFEVRVSSDAAEADLANNWARFEFFVTRRQPEITGATDVGALPGQTAAFALTVANRGNAAELIVVTETPSVRDPAWALAFSQTQFTLAPGETAPLQVYITVPPSAVAGDFTPAEVGVVSWANTSRSAFLALTARASTFHTLDLTPLPAALNLAPGAATTVSVRLTNHGNVAEAVTVTLTPQWAAASWLGGSKVIGLEPGASGVVDLPLTAADNGSAGYRGELLVRAVLSSNGEAFETRLPAFLDAFVCLRLALSTWSPPPPPFNVALAADLTVENCGNVPLAGALHAEAPAGVAVTMAGNFTLGAHGTARLPVQVLVPADAPDGVYPVRFFADAGDGISAHVNWSLTHISGVFLEAVELLPHFHAAAGANSFSYRVANTGSAAWVDAPTVTGVPPGWTVAVAPDMLRIDGGAVGTFFLLVDTGNSSTADSADLALVFEAGGSTLTGHAQVTRSVELGQPGIPVPSSVWPTDWTPVAAVGVGLLAALAAAAFARPSRGLRRACPACGRKAPAFDTFLNPTCPQCGGALERADSSTR